MQKQYRLTTCVASNLGKHRANHEDNFLLDNGQYILESEQKKLLGVQAGWKLSIQKNLLQKSVSNALFAVSDGMGGHNAGEVASRVAVEQLFSMKDYLFKTPDYVGITSRFQDYIMKANTLIALKASQDSSLKGMGATLTGIMVSEAGVIPFNLGDSRTYQFDGRHLRQISRDHTEAQRLLDFDLIKIDELHLIDGGKGITRYLGIDDRFLNLEAELGDVIGIEGRTWFLICSDGLTDLVGDDEIERVLQEHINAEKLSEIPDILVGKALQDKGERHGGIDNVTVLLVEIEGVEPTTMDKAKKWWKEILNQ